MKFLRRFFSAVPLVLMGTVLFASTAGALILNSQDEIYFDEYAAEDVYLAGGNITIQQDIDGDLYVAGGNVTVNGNIGGDLVVAGGNIIVNGVIKDDLRILAGSLSLNADVEGDLIMLGGNADINKETMVHGDLVTVSGATNLYGTVNKSVRGMLGRLVIAGQVNGNVDVRVTEKLVLLNTGHVAGDVTYFAPEQIEDHGGIIDGAVNFDITVSTAEQVEDQLRSALTRNYFMGRLWSFLSLFLIGLIMLAIFPHFLGNVSDRINEKALKSFGVGFLVFILGGILAVIALATVIGVQLAFILFALLYILGELGRIAAGYWIGDLIISRFSSQKHRRERNGSFWKHLGVFALGLFLLKLVGLIPILGWLATFIFFLIGVGASMLVGRDIHQRLTKERLI